MSDGSCFNTEIIEYYVVFMTFPCRNSKSVFIEVSIDLQFSLDIANVSSNFSEKLLSFF